MVINTKEFGSRIKLGIMLGTAVFAILVVVSLIFGWSKAHYLEYGIGILYLLCLTFILLKNFSYIYYNSDGPKIIIRYSPLQPLSYGNYSVEIPRRDFVKAEIKSSHFGLRKNLIVYVRTPQGIAKFKPISFTIFSKKGTDNILDDLARIS